MKKTLVIFLSILYLIIVSGGTYNMHYCGGKLKHITFLNYGDADGCCGSKKKSKGCCKDKTTVIKVEENHQVTKVAQINNPTIHFLATVATQLLYSLSISTETNRPSYYYGPPVLYDNHLYLKHRVLLI